MAAHGDEQLTLAKVYASAMLDAVKDSDAVAAFGGELREFAKFLESEPEAWGYLSSRTMDAAKKRDILEKMLRGRANDMLVDALQIVNDNGRLSLLPAIVRAFEQLQRELGGRVEVQVRTAAPLKAPQEQRVRDIIRKRTGKEADLIVALDQSLIAGLLVQIGDEKLDASVSRKLAKMHCALMERGSREAQRIESYVDEAAA